MTRISVRKLCSLSRALVVIMVLMMIALASLSYAESNKLISFKRIPLQYIAALGDPSATAGNNAHLWGLWRRDPGPRGMRIRSYAKLKARGGIAPAGWKFDQTDWWLEEHGLMMEKPDFPVPPGKYVVTGGRRAKTILTVYPEDKNGAQRWELANGVKLYDVTHLPCRSARYTPGKDAKTCSPANAQQKAFPVARGAPMPQVAGCNKQDYAVLFVIGVPAEQ